MRDDKQKNKNWKDAGMMLATMLVLACVTMAPTMAWAAPSFGFDPSCSDRSISDYLAPIFGGLFESCGGGAGGSGRAFELAIGILNAGALTFGGIIASYTLVVGTMQTAHDGEMLGKKWSSMWLPIRTLLGVGLVVPLSNGYCVAQFLIAFMIGQGVGFADTIWSMYLTNYAAPRGMAPTNRLPNVTTLAKGILTSQLCVAAYNAVQAQTTGINSRMMSMSSTPGGRDTPSVINFGFTPGGGSQGNECGSVSYRSSADPTDLADVAGMAGMSRSSSAAPGGLSVVSNAALKSVDMAAMDLAQMRAAGAMAVSFERTASKIVNFRDSAGGAPDVVADMNRAIVAYQTTVTAAVGTVFGSQDAMTTYVTAARTDGWYLAGAWFMKAAQLQDMVNVSVSNVPSTTPPDATMLGNDTALLGAIAPYFTQLDKSVASAATTAGSSMLGQDPVDLATSKSGNPLKEALSRFSSSIGGSIFSVFQLNPTRSAIMSIKDIGDGTMTASEVAMVSGVTMVAASSGIKAVNEGFVGQVVSVASFGVSSFVGGSFAGAVSVVGYLLIVLGSIFFGLGSMIAVYLPFAPFLLYFGAFVGWLILCGEAIIAAPIWAVMHLTPSGDDVMGGARQGYMLILGLLFRPALIVLGFIFALTAVNVIVQGFNGVFFPVFKLAMTGSVMGLGTILVMLCIYFGTMVWIFHTVFGLIHVIPDKLLRWIGGGGEGLGESARGISKAGESGAGSAARHSDSVRQSMMTGIQTGTQIGNANRSRAQGLEHAASSAGMQEKAASGRAAIADAKSSAPGSKPEDQLEAVSSHLQTGAAASSSAKAGLEANGVDPQSKSGKELIGKAQEEAMLPHTQKANAVAASMVSKAEELESNFNDNHSGDSKHSPEGKAAGESAANQYKAAADAQAMLGNKGQEAALLQKAGQVMAQTKAPAGGGGGGGGSKDEENPVG